MIDMTGKTALITGASRGIGAACARALGRTGAGVIVHFARNRDKAEAVARELGDGNAGTLQADLAEPGTARGLWTDARAWRGRIDVLVNNAGIFEPAAPEGPGDAWDEVWERTLRVNLTAVGDLCRLAVADFAGQGGGVIVNVASRAAHRGDGPRYWAYGAAKAGVVALTKTIARNWAAERVLAYAVAPGFTATDMADKALTDPDARARAVAEIPMGELTPPEDVANVVAFLASGAAPHATGTTVDINGASYVR
ncbi:MAG: SDR family NAD(P)-dependent oxidoreductase [Rhodospirillales bacterium]